jgi:transposase-like protein
LEKDQDALLAFYDFPAEHWIHIRTTHPIESTFATVRLRTAKTRGCVSRESILAMVFMLVKSAERRWLRSCLEIPASSQAIQHQTRHGDINPGFVRASETLIAFAEAA